MSAAPWAYRWVKAGGIRTRYIEAGDGPPLVLCHGGGPGYAADLAWPKNVPELAKHFRVLAIDVLGHGETDKPAGLLYSHQDQVDHLASFIDTLCLQPLYLAGNSMGAYQVFKLALDHPDWVRKVMGISSGTISHAMGLDHRPPPWEYTWTVESLAKGVAATLLHPPDMDIVRKRHEHSLRPGAREAYEAMTAYARRLRQDSNLLQRFQVQDRLPRMTIPAKIIWGREDRFAPVTFAKDLQALLPNIPIEIVENAGHQVQHDAPHEVNRRMIAFFQE